MRNPTVDLTPKMYRESLDSILTKTLGKVPDIFVYDGKQYTPMSFEEERIGISPDDYVEITSYSHHLFYAKFALEIEANWNNEYYPNLPINDFRTVIEEALLHDYSVGLDGDTYEGFKDGFAVLGENRSITQEIRQAVFDNRTTEDVLNYMLII